MCQWVSTDALYPENAPLRAWPVRCASAWIDPDGRFYPVTDCGHAEFAYRNFRTYDLESRGWMHVSFGFIHRSKIATQAQLNTMFDLASLYSDHGYHYAPMFRLALMEAMNEAE